MKIYNPATNQLIREIEILSPGDIPDVFQELKAGQKNWAKRAYAERQICIQKFKELLEENIESLATTLTSEVGKPIKQSRGEIKGAANRVQWFIDNSEKWLQPETVAESDNMTEHIRYEPLGVVCNISAWNYPYLVGMNVIIPALLAGNSVAYKPSECASLTGLEIGKLMYHAGIPGNVFKTICGDAETGEALLNLPFDGYFFTGSNKTGQYIYEKVATKMVPCQMELGGKDPLYVTDEIDDLDQVASAAMDGAFYNTGQSCCSVERIYVHENVYDAFVKSFFEAAQGIVVGNPMDESTYVGAITRRPQIEVLKNQVADALDKGAELKLGGKEIQIEGNFFQPTILTNVKHNMLIMSEESFGPIIGIQEVRSDEEAISLMLWLQMSSSSSSTFDYRCLRFCDFPAIVVL